MTMLKYFGFSFMILLTFFKTTKALTAEFSGKELYDLKCGRCHVAYAPQQHSLEEWKTLMKEMGPVSGLDEKSEEAIMSYLASETSRDTSPVLPTHPVIAGYLYTEFFSSSSSVDTFDIHYLNLNLSGRLHDRVSYRAEFELEHGGGESEPPFVEQAYMDVWLGRNTAFRIGAFLAPFNRFDDFHAPLENFLVTRPQVSREIGVSAWKEVGIDFHGSFALSPRLYFNYDIYVINGLGAGSRLRSSRQYRDNNDAKSFGFRLSGVFSDHIEAGWSYYRGAWDNQSQMNLSILGFHLLGRFGDLSCHAEYARARSENPADVDPGKGSGYFVQFSYIFWDRFRPTFRMGNLDYLDRSGLAGRSPVNFDQKVMALGFNFYLSHAIVFKAEYDFYLEGERIQARDNDLLAFQAAVRF